MKSLTKITKLTLATLFVVASFSCSTLNATREDALQTQTERTNWNPFNGHLRQRILRVISNHPKTTISLALIIFLGCCAKFETKECLDMPNCTEYCFRGLGNYLCFYSGNCPDFDDF